MSAEYVRDTYNVDFKVGDRVTVDGRPGIIVSFPGQYLGVRFDGERHTSRAHPTWRVEREAPTDSLTAAEDRINRLSSLKSEMFGGLLQNLELFRVIQ